MDLHRFARPPSALALLLALLAAPARADDDAGDAGDLGQLLDSIPDIEQPAPAADEAAEAEPAPPRDVTFPDYVRAVRQAVLAAWEPPAKLARKHPGLVARVLVQVDASGRITEVAMVQASGEPKFDKAVLKALQAVDAVPAPPPAYRDDAANGLVVDVPARRR